MAIEVKGSMHVNKRDLGGLSAFMDEYPSRKNIVVCNERQRRVHGKIDILPWKYFLSELWRGNIL